MFSDWMQVQAASRWKQLLSFTHGSLRREPMTEAGQTTWPAPGEEEVDGGCWDSRKKSSAALCPLCLTFTPLAA